MVKLQGLSIVYDEMYAALSYPASATSLSPQADSNISVYKVDVSESANLRSSGEIKKHPNVPSEGYKIIHFDENNYNFLILTPMGFVISLPNHSLMSIIAESSIINGELQGKHCLAKTGNSISIISEDSESYKRAIRASGDNKPVQLHSASVIVPGSVCINRSSGLSVYLGKFDVLETSGISSHVDSLIRRGPRQMYYLYNVDSDSLVYVSSLAEHVNSVIPNFVIMEETEAYMYAFYNSKNHIPLMAEPEIYIENLPTNTAHMMWIEGLDRYTYPEVLSVNPIDGGKNGFAVKTTGRGISAVKDKNINYLVLRAGGLKRAI